MATFDALADTYDDTFTNSHIGQAMRNAVWRRLEQHFHPGDRIIELNCGTGTDAQWLTNRGCQVLATDISPEMVARTANRGINTIILDAQNVRTLANEGPFDGALSNFGGLNCVEQIGAVAHGLWETIKPDGTAIVCIMGPAVPWEWAWYLAKGKPRQAFRRIRGKTTWRNTTIRYPTAKAAQTIFDPWFETTRTWALGTLIPPSYAEPLAKRAPWLIRILDRIERRIETTRLAVFFADHYVLELRRR